ncbi:MAG: aminotransferase class I/II-fold pyridoxal phosphate-dependent enzyme [Gammaproteobacteria bacterium]
MPAALRQRLARWQQARLQDGLVRRRALRGETAGSRANIGGRTVVNFCSNDYLGLATDPRLAEAAQQAARIHGYGSGASALVCGYTAVHEELEAALAHFLGRERAIVLPSGYHANLAVLGTFVARGDTVVADRYIHASLIDAALMSRARLRRYPHNDAGTADRLCAQSAAGLVLLVTEGVFSMEGDVAPLAALRQVAASRDACLVVDDAHGIGVLGEHGAGALEISGLARDRGVHLLVGTLGKAFGAAGAFVAGAADLIDELMQQARSYRYTTAMPAPVAAAALTALHIIRNGPERPRLTLAIARFREAAAAAGLAVLPSQSPIQPLLVGDSARAVRLSDSLLEAGFHVAAIRPPTVPPGTARLRITLSAAHADEQIDRLVDTLARLWQER